MAAVVAESIWHYCECRCLVVGVVCGHYQSPDGEISGGLAGYGGWLNGSGALMLNQGFGGLMSCWMARI